MIEQDGDRHSTDAMGGTFLFEEAIDLADSMEWPKLQVLDIAKVWTWVIEQEGFLEGFGGGPTGRALNAFTHLFESPRADDATMLFWALVGIEALYVRGRQGLLEQVRDKSQVLLGKQEAHKKKINRMYDFRSRFVHGDLDFAGRHLLHDAAENLAKHESEMFESIFLAVAILLASLQKLVLLEWKGVKFNYVMTERSE